MSTPARDLESKAMRLPRKARARLARRLISSLDKLWLQEAEHRLRELKSGKVAAIPAEKVISKARAALR